jgi:hypothetical protein
MISEIDIQDMCEEPITDEIEDYERKYSFWDTLVGNQYVYVEVNYG